MTVSTMLWPTNGTGDGIATGYTDEQVQALWQALHNPDGDDGVAPHYLNGLRPYSEGADDILVDSGMAVIAGIPLFNDAEVTLTPTVPASDTAGLVVARVNWSTQTGEIALVEAADGVTTVPSPTQTAGVLWEIPLAKYHITSGGIIYANINQILGVKDLRTFITGAGLMHTRHRGYRAGSTPASQYDIWNLAGEVNQSPIRSEMVTGCTEVTLGVGVDAAQVIATFGGREFPGGPIVVATIQSEHYEGQIVKVYNANTTDVQLRVERTDTNNARTYQVNWIAIGGTKWVNLDTY